MLDQAFDALKEYDWGKDIGPLKPIDEQMVATFEDVKGRRDLEQRLIDVLNSDVSRAAKDFVCRKLRVVGTETCVSPLAALLPDPQMSHMARYALECIPLPIAGDALRDSIAQVSTPLKLGVISSLGVRREDASVKSLSKLLDTSDAAVASAAAFALGAIRSKAASEALAKSVPVAGARRAKTDASLACAEGLLENGDKRSALAIYQGLAKNDQPKHVRLAATRGLLACAGT